MQPGVESVVPIEIDDGLLVCTVVIVPALLLQGIAVILRSVQRFREIQVRQLYVDLLPAGKLDLAGRTTGENRYGRSLLYLLLFTGRVGRTGSYCLLYRGLKYMGCTVDT